MRILTCTLILVVLLATAGLGWLFDQVYVQTAQNEKDQNVDAVSVLEQFGSELAQTLNSSPDRYEFAQRWQAKNKYKLEIVSLDELILPERLIAQIKQGKPLLLETKKQVIFHYYLSAGNELLILKSPVSELKKANQSLDYIFTLMFYLALLVVVLLWVFPLVRQLLKLRQTAKLFGEGDLRQRVAPGSISYIRDIETEFNHMAQRIESLVGDVKLLSSAVSHDLRTPLARIRFGIDTLQEEDDPEVRRRFEQKISSNVDEMTELVETLLGYARLDQAMLEIKKEPVELSQLISQCINNKVTDLVELRLFKAETDYTVVADQSYLTILFNNLLQNAINYGRGKVIVTLSETKDSVTVCVADNGEGIIEEHREDILKPFVRGLAGKQNNVVGQNKKGHGIGLAIVKRILDWHHGDIQVGNSKELSGARFCVTLPR